MVTTILPQIEVTRRKPANLELKDSALFSHEFSLAIPSVLSIEKKKIYFLPELFFIGRNLSIDRDLTPPRLVDLPLKSKVKIFVLNAFRSFKTIKKPTALIIDDWSEGYFHWMADALPRLWLIHQINPTLTILLPDHFQKHDYILQTLNAFDMKVFFYKKNTRYYLHHLTSVTLTAPSGNYREDLMRNVRSRVVKFYFGEPQSAPVSKVYLSRSKASKRRIVNEVEVERILKEFGYRSYRFEDLAWKQQIEIMSSTRNFISNHGSGLTNMIFMPLSGSVLELRRKNDAHNNCFFSMASAFGHDYYYQECTSDSDNTFSANLMVDLDTFKNNLMAMEHRQSL